MTFFWQVLVRSCEVVFLSISSLFHYVRLFNCSWFGHVRFWFDCVIFSRSCEQPCLVLCDVWNGDTDELQLDLMEKDIVIEQLRTQLKQLRTRMSEMENEAAIDTAPLEGLLSQLGELKVRVK